MGSEHLLAMIFGDCAAAARDVSDWEHVVSAASKHVVLGRLADRLNSHGVPLPSVLEKAVASERVRITATVKAIHSLATVFARNDQRFVLLKSFQHWPDMGHDIDVLIGAQPRLAKEILLTSGATRCDESLVNLVAGKRSWSFPGSPSPLEVHHARTGLVGEYKEFARALLRRSLEPESGPAIGLPIPQPEDEAILRVIQRVYSHFGFRIGDVLAAIRTEGEMNRDVVAARARALAISEGLGIVDRLVARAKAGDLKEIDLEISRKAAVGMLTTRIRALAADRQWGASARACLIPALGVWTASRQMWRSRAALAHEFRPAPERRRDSDAA